MSRPKPHVARIGAFRGFDNTEGRELTCLTSKKTVGAKASPGGYPTDAQLLETLDWLCRGKNEEDAGLHVIESISPNAV